MSNSGGLSSRACATAAASLFRPTMGRATPAREPSWALPMRNSRDSRRLVSGTDPATMAKSSGACATTVRAQGLRQQIEFTGGLVRAIQDSVRAIMLIPRLSRDGPYEQRESRPLQLAQRHRAQGADRGFRLHRTPISTSRSSWTAVGPRHRLDPAGDAHPQAHLLPGRLPSCTSSPAQKSSIPAPHQGDEKGHCLRGKSASRRSSGRAEMEMFDARRTSSIQAPTFETTAAKP